jgi:MFS family permease
MGRLPKGVVALGFVSLFMDMSSEAIHALLPLFLVGTLGASAFYVGLIEGLGEATAQITKLFSGVLSDWTGKRKPLAIVGYGLSAVTKPLFALAGGPGAVLTARLADRVGKGIRGAPRDALVADLVPEAQRGAAYGLRQSMDTFGAVFGPALALALMWAWGDVRLVFWLAIVPAVIAVLVLVVFVREPEVATPIRRRPPLDRAALVALGRPFWGVVAIGAVLTLARVSEAFLILKAGDVGLTIANAPLVLILLNLVYAFSAWPVGVLSDKIGQRGLMLAGFGLLVGADLVLAFASGLGGVLLGVALWGLHMGMTQGLLSAAVARHAPSDLRATGFGAFNLVTGLVLLLGNAIAGAAWSLSGPEAAFGLGAVFASFGLIGLWRKG